MALDPISAVLGIGEKLIGHFFPDPKDADNAKLKLLQLQQSGDLAEMTGQLEINKIEAEHPSMFVAGGRPFIIWVCGVALALSYIPKALFLSVFWAYQAYSTIHAGGTVLPVFPDLGVTDLLGLLGAILGLGGLRTFEKFSGVQTVEVKKKG
jgi:hypothetical protein